MSTKMSIIGKEVCPFCSGGMNDRQVVQIGERGVNGIRKACSERGDDLCVAVGQYVHVECRRKYTNPKDIENFKRHSTAETIKRASKRLSVGPFDYKSECLYCGQNVIVNTSHRPGESFSCVKTDTFVKSLKQCCNERNDEWASDVRGRIEYCSGDLHAADSVYHNSCDSNFRRGGGLPAQFTQCNNVLESEPEIKRKRPGRPENEEQSQAFAKLCALIETNDERQWTILELCEYMASFPEHPDIGSYSSKWMKEKLKSYFGDSIVFSQKEGLGDVITLRETTHKILRTFYENTRTDSSDEGKKIAMISATIKFLRNDTISNVETVNDSYPKSSELSLASALDFLPDTVRYFCQGLISGKETKQKVASLGQAIVQAIRPRAVIAPLQLGLAVQLHYHLRQRHVIDTLNTMGFCSSYNEVLRFNLNAACSEADMPIGTMSEQMALSFAADNVDHDKITIDGKGVFHGMGMIAAVTPRNQIAKKIPRIDMAKLDVTSQSKIDIKHYHHSGQTRKLSFDALLKVSICPKIDILWQLKPHHSTPNWGGSMSLIYKDRAHHGQSSVYFLNMIDMRSSDKTCIFSTLSYLSNLAHNHKLPAIITFDQPLFWKASEILNDLNDENDLKNIVLMLGSFHTLMNLLGAIGTLMDGAGLREVLQVIYGENTVENMLHGRAVQRALRGFLTVDKCLTQYLVRLISVDDEQFGQTIDTLNQKYESIMNGSETVESLTEDETFMRVLEVMNSKKNELSSKSKTSELWFGFQYMMQVARNLVRGDRMGDWQIHKAAVYDCLEIFGAAGHFNYLKSAHMYLQNMAKLETTQPKVNAMFEQGLFVLRRTEKFWAGLGLDLGIEQLLMRALKTSGGLTRGSNMTEKQIALWTMSAPVCSQYNQAMQEFTGKMFETSEQHKETMTCRIKRDADDSSKVFGKFNDYPPLITYPSLRNIISGMEANPQVNVVEFREVGRRIMDKMVGQQVFSYSFKRKDRAVTMASTTSLKVDEDRSIKSIALFQRLLVVSQTGEVSLSGAMEYELCPFPPSLFESKNLMRAPDKPALMQALAKYIQGEDKDNKAILDSIPITDWYVMDGGSLLHRIKWKPESSYGSIIKSYVKLLDKYGLDNTTIVFDGYDSGPTTKYCTQERRHPCKSNKVHFTLDNIFRGKKEEFLSNSSNKQLFITMLGTEIAKAGGQVVHANGDADLDIVLEAVNTSLIHSTTVIGEDTDVLVLLLYHSKHPVESEKLYFRTDKEAKHIKVYDISLIKQIMGERVCKRLLFLHAFTGCDTTSRIFGIGKSTAFSRLMKSIKLGKSADLFTTVGKNVDEISTAGCEAMLTLFNSKEESLAKLRHNQLTSKVFSSKTFVAPERLPPTASATMFHSLRTYHQIMTWMAVSGDMAATDWGWNMSNDKLLLLPIMTDQLHAPDELLRIVHCNCTTHCDSMRCGCRRYGLSCTSACGSCQTDSCDNSIKPDINADREDDDALHEIQNGV